MKAIVFDGLQKVECRNVDDPRIEKDDDIIVKVTSTAICLSLIHISPFKDDAGIHGKPSPSTAVH